MGDLNWNTASKNLPFGLSKNDLMRILLTNDDGILSPVLSRVAEALALDHDVVVVAPSTDQSGKSHSFTHGPHKLLYYQQEKGSTYPAYQVQGTPSDCVKFAISHLFRKAPFDLVVSGINLGENAGISSIYSGTVAAAREAALWGTPGIAISLWHTAEDHLKHALAWLRSWVGQPSLLPKPGEFWNVNFPPCKVQEIQGTRIASMSTVMFSDGYVAVTDEHGLVGYRLEGHKPKHLFVAGTDDHALSQGFIAVVPMRLTQPAPEIQDRLKSQQTLIDSITRAVPLQA
jgi:5'-nucleotidase